MSLVLAGPQTCEIMSANPQLPNVLHLGHLSISDANWDNALRQLLEHVRPDWQFDNTRQQLFTDGITNRLVAMHQGEKIHFGDDVILVRIYGANTELIIDRQAEIRNMQLLQANGFCQPLYATFANGLCYGYIHGDVADEDMIRDPQVSRLISRELAAFHCQRLDPAVCPDQTPALFPTMRRWLELGPDSFTEPVRQARLRSALPDKAGLRAEVDELESRLPLAECPVVFSHNDTLIKNFVYNRRESRVYLIDYEYCAFNYLPFDIANHFAEFAGVATVDHSRYPSREFQLEWLRHYLNYRDGFLGNATGDSEDSRVEQLQRHVTQFSLASHLFWTLWALVQARHSNLEFDFLEYAITRYSEFAAKKAERLSA